MHGADDATVWNGEGRAGWAVTRLVGDGARGLGKGQHGLADVVLLHVLQQELLQVLPQLGGDGDGPASRAGSAAGGLALRDAGARAGEGGGLGGRGRRAPHHGGLRGNGGTRVAGKLLERRQEDIDANGLVGHRGGVTASPEEAAAVLLSLGRCPAPPGSEGPRNRHSHPKSPFMRLLSTTSAPDRAGAAPRPAG